MNRPLVSLSVFCIFLFWIVFHTFYLSLDYTAPIITGRQLAPGDSSTVDRSFSSDTIRVGDSITVSLDINVDESFTHNVYVIEETVPNNWEITNNGGGSVSGRTIRFAYIDDANPVTDDTLTYTVRATRSGTFDFDGVFGYDGMIDPEDIGDEYRVVVGDCSSGETRSCGDDTGECQEGVETCINNEWSGDCVGDITPGTEICDNRDNDCDGQTDEGLSQTQSCGVGECQHTINTCVNGQPETCNPYQGATAEVCEGSRDEDCDGNVDEGCSCTTGQTQDCGIDVGQCQEGTQTCTNGIWGSCAGEIGPSAEVCDGLDNDCDGTPDDGISQPVSCGEGICFHTIQTCTNGQPQTCNPYEGAQSEVCEGSLDEDCDGQVDEGCSCTTGDTQVCGTDVGQCQAGTQTCTNGVWSSTCAGEIAASTETCDGLDNDCNGAVDDHDFGTSTCGLGICRNTINNCIDGALTTCNATLGATEEICEGVLDEDCDGQIDEGCSCVTGESRLCGTDAGACIAGNQSCINGTWATECVDEVIASAEICDGVDNDCNGQTDDANFGTTTCGQGACAHTINICVDGVNQTCDPFEGSTNEICADQIDNDCDGSVNEQCSCTENQSISCVADNGCQGEQVCDNDQYGLCIAVESLCDINCDGNQVCTSDTCVKCNCIEKWSCDSSYGACIDGIQERTCRDANSCGSVANKPETEKACFTRKPSTPTTPTGRGDDSALVDEPTQIPGRSDDTTTPETKTPIDGTDDEESDGGKMNIFFFVILALVAVLALGGYYYFSQNNISFMQQASPKRPVMPMNPQVIPHKPVAPPSSMGAPPPQPKQQPVRQTRPQPRRQSYARPINYSRVNQGKALRNKQTKQIMDKF